MKIVHEEKKALEKISDQEIAKRLASRQGLADLDLSEYSGVINASSNTTFVGCSFRKHTFKDAHWLGLTFEGCDFTGAVFEPGCEIADCRLNARRRTDVADTAEGTILDDVEFKCVLRGLRFNGVRLNRTSFMEATWESGKETNSFADCAGQSTVFGHVDAPLLLSATHFRGAKFLGFLRNVDGRGPGPSFEKCCFDDVTLSSCAFDNALFSACSFQRAKLGIAFQGGTDLRGSDFRDADWSRAALQNVTIDGAKLWPCRGLTGRHQAELVKVLGAERAIYARNWLDAWFSWSRIRGIGSIPLFGVSYFALVAICIWASAIHWTNALIARLKDDDRLMELLPWLRAVLNAIDHLPTGWRMAGTLSAIVCLAVGATVYLFACPSEIRENSETAWTYNLRYERMRYLALAVTKRWWRYLAGGTYFIGGVYIFFDLLQRIVSSFFYLWPDASRDLKSLFGAGG